MAALDAAAALRERGNARAEAGDFGEALSLFAAATRADASDFRAWEAMAQVLLEASGADDDRALARAVVAARTATAVAPEWAPGALTLGRCLLAARRWVEARAALAGARALDVCGDGSLGAEIVADLAEAKEREAASAAAPGAARTLRVGVGGYSLETTADGGEAAAACGCPARGPGARVWECGVVLAMCLEWRCAAGDATLAGVRALELGSGLGIAGLGAALLGAQVLLTDTGDTTPATAARVAAHADALGASGGSAETAVLDWREPVSAAVVAAGPFALVLAADACYRPDMVRPFFAALDAVVTAETAEVLVCHKRRSEETDAALEAGLRSRFAVYGRAPCHPLYASAAIDVWRASKVRVHN